MSQIGSRSVGEAKWFDPLVCSTSAKKSCSASSPKITGYMNSRLLSFTSNICESLISTEGYALSTDQRDSFRPLHFEPQVYCKVNCKFSDVLDISRTVAPHFLWFANTVFDGLVRWYKNIILPRKLNNCFHWNYFMFLNNFVKSIRRKYFIHYGWETIICPRTNENIYFLSSLT